MLPEWSAALVAKAKVAALLSAALATGGAGGAVALSHVTPTTQVVTEAAATSPDPESSDATDPETTQAGDPETTDAGDPESTDAGDPESGQAGDPGSYTLPPCPSDVKNHGAYVSSVAKSAPKGKGGVHGHWVSQAAQSDCGKPSAGSGDPESSDASGGSTDPESTDASGGSTDPESTDAQDSATEPSAPTTGHGHSADHGTHGHGHGHSDH
jgi:hypothetical protein